MSSMPRCAFQSLIGPVLCHYLLPDLHNHQHVHLTAVYKFIHSDILQYVAQPLSLLSWVLLPAEMQNLPVELQLQIASFLDVETILSLRKAPPFLCGYRRELKPSITDVHIIVSIHP